MLNFFTKALIKRQLKGKVPEAEMDRLLGLIEKNPEIFQKMAVSIQEKMQKGMSQEEAAQEFMREEGDVLKGIMQ